MLILCQESWQALLWSVSLNPYNKFKRSTLSSVFYRLETKASEGAHPRSNKQETAAFESSQCSSEPVLTLTTTPSTQSMLSRKISRLLGHVFQNNKEQSLTKSDGLICISLPVIQRCQFQCNGNYLWHVLYGGILFGLLRWQSSTPLLLFIFTFYLSLSAILLNNSPSQT